MTRPATSRSRLPKRGVALLLLSLVAACGSESGSASGTSTSADGGTSADGDTSANGSKPADGGKSGDGGMEADGRRITTPTVVSNAPLSGGAGAPLNGSVSATFSEAMDSATLTATTFTLTSATAAVPGKVIYANRAAVFWPAVHLASNSAFTATITRAAKSAYGVALGATHTWSFTTGTAVAPGVGVDLGTAGDYVILTKSGISTVPTSAILGNIGVSPAAADSITGFPLTADPTNVFSITPQVTGKVFAADYAFPTPSNLTAAIGDMQSAFTNAAARAPDVTELGAGDIGGLTLIPGVYKWSSGLLIATDVTLVGNATDVWIFQIAQTLTMSSDTKIVLSGGALPRNVFWQAAGLVELGTGAHCEGVVLAQTAATLGTGASVQGRLLAQTAVTLAGSTIVQPAP